MPMLRIELRGYGPNKQVVLQKKKVFGTMEGFDDAAARYHLGQARDKHTQALSESLATCGRQNVESGPEYTEVCSRNLQSQSNQMYDNIIKCWYMSVVEQSQQMTVRIITSHPCAFDRTIMRQNVGDRDD